MRSSSLVLMSAFVAATAACARGASSPGVGAVSPGGGRDSITLVIDNQNFYDANVYYQMSSSQRRLGSVSGNATRTFRIRWEPASLVVRVDFVGAGSAYTDAYSVEPEEYVEIVVPPDAHQRSDRLRRVRDD